ncbi:hypothetical protein HU200_031721 [Digitaria exilis]|uniref:Cytochrome P450 n=1 Tax=Digitaria exilis TaxID=1010633 RepID=A0A835ET21_9POAL|nr:hypothetical protein HU200_031721 [Digitaria exilis]
MANLAQQQFIRELTAPRACLLLLLPLFLLLVRYWFTAKRARKTTRQQQQQEDEHLPPSPPALPVLGHLHLVGSLPHVSLRSLARKHGYDLMLLRLGAMPIVVVSSPHAAEAVLRTHDHVFASRPHSMVAEIVLYGPSDVGFAPHGEYWRQARKLVTTHLLTVKRIQSLRHAREEEVSTVMVKIGEAAAAGAAVDVGDLLISYTNDLAGRAVMGKSSREDGRSKLFRQLVVDTSPLLGGFNVEEFFPFLARFGVLSKVVRGKSERLRRRWDELLDRLIDDHESKRRPTATAGGSKDEDDDFIDVLLSLMRRPHAMRKLQAEVRSIVPKGQEIVGEADLSTMSYLRAVVKESLRLHAVAPLLAPHLSTASCRIDIDGGEVVVPAGVRVLINVWAMARDPRFWEDAEEFIPERFLDGGSAAEVGFKGNDFQFLPFSSGRRQCPGMNFGLAAVEVMLANLVHRFDWEMPPGKEARDIDMSEEFGLVVHRKEKLMLRSAGAMVAALATGIMNSIGGGREAAKAHHRYESSGPIQLEVNDRPRAGGFRLVRGSAASTPTLERVVSVSFEARRGCFPSRLRLGGLELAIQARAGLVGNDAQRTATHRSHDDVVKKRESLLHAITYPPKKTSATSKETMERRTQDTTLDAVNCHEKEGRYVSPSHVVSRSWKARFPPARCAVWTNSAHNDKHMYSHPAPLVYKRGGKPMQRAKKTGRDHNLGLRSSSPSPNLLVNPYYEQHVIWCIAPLLDVRPSGRNQDKTSSLTLAIRETSG